MEYGSVPIVIDNGSDTCKAGFAGEDAPRTVFCSIVGRPIHSSTLGSSSRDYVGDEAQSKREMLAIAHPMERGSITNWDDMEKIWDHAFSNELRINAQEHPVLLTEAPLNIKANREKTAQIMFETFDVPAFYLADSAVLSLYAATARTTGVVLESGHDATYAIPIYESHSIKHATLRLDVSGRRITDSLVEMLAASGQPAANAADYAVVRDIKQRLGYITRDFEHDLQTMVFPSGLELSYEYSDGRIVKLGNERFRAPEALLKPYLLGIEEGGVHRLVHDAILKCDAELHRALYRNIALSGGSTMFPGLADRMHAELAALAPPDTEIRIVAAPERKYTSWIGGSILASQETFQRMFVSKQEYDEFGPKIVNWKCV